MLRDQFGKELARIPFDAENAYSRVEEALMWLQRRTVARIKRGVEGTNQK